MVSDRMHKVIICDPYVTEDGFAFPFLYQNYADHVPATGPADLSGLLIPIKFEQKYIVRDSQCI